MKNSVWESSGVGCPFYRCEDSYSVYCAGFISGQYIRNSFSGPSLRREYGDRYCRGDWRRCFFSDADARRRAGDSSPL